MKFKVWVSGVSSFVGAAVARDFSVNGHDVVGVHSRPFDLYEGIQADRLAGLIKDGVRLAAVDIRDADALVKSVEKERPTVAIHHAGWVNDYAGWNYDMTQGHSVNVAPLLPLIQTLVRVGAKGLVVTGSAAEYPDSRNAHHERVHAPPSLPYGLSKLTETYYAHQLSIQQGLRVRVGRLFIPFGPGDTPAKVLPSVVQALHHRRSIDLSPCVQRRDFVYIDDIVDGYRRLVLDLDRAEAFDLFNLSSGQGTRLRDILETLADEWGAPRDLLHFGARPLRPGEPEACFGSKQKARQQLGWCPRSWKEGVRSYVMALRQRTSP